jgi:hypothetical protein
LTGQLAESCGLSSPEALSIATINALLFLVETSYGYVLSALLKGLEVNREPGKHKEMTK